MTSAVVVIVSPTRSVWSSAGSVISTARGPTVIVSGVRPGTSSVHSCTSRSSSGQSAGRQPAAGCSEPLTLTVLVFVTLQVMNHTVSALPGSQRSGASSGWTAVSDSAISGLGTLNTCTAGSTSSYTVLAVTSIVPAARMRASPVARSMSMLSVGSALQSTV